TRSACHRRPAPWTSGYSRDRPMISAVTRPAWPVPSSRGWPGTAGPTPADPDREPDLGMIRPPHGVTPAGRLVPHLGRPQAEGGARVGTVTRERDTREGERWRSILSGSPWPVPVGAPEATPDESWPQLPAHLLGRAPSKRGDMPLGVSSAGRRREEGR